MDSGRRVATEHVDQPQQRAGDVTFLPQPSALEDWQGDAGFDAGEERSDEGILHGARGLDAMVLDRHYLRLR